MTKHNQPRSADPAAEQMLEHAAGAGLATVWDRLAAQQPHCRLGEQGVCCRLCQMGPCRIGFDGRAPQQGVCGADADTIVARNLVRMVAAGTASHAEQGRHVALLLKSVAEGSNREYAVTDPAKLRRVALRLGIAVDSLTPAAQALAVADAALACFGRQEEGAMPFVEAYMPASSRERLGRVDAMGQGGEWRNLLPRNIDREAVDILHRSHYGTDHDHRSLLAQAVRCALADGWGGSMIATEIQDVLFGTPSVQTTRANLGVLDEAAVNIVVHGHEPVLSEKIIDVARSEEMQQLARSRGASGVKVVGVCCTVNEALRRRGVEMAGNHLHQELAVMTGVVEALVVDVQCIFPVMADLARCFHTRFITTSEQARFPGSLHIPLVPERATAIARRIVTTAIDAYAERDPQRVFIPQQTAQAQVGFGLEEIERLLGGSLAPLAQGLKEGRVRGIAALVGCNNPKVTQDYLHINLTRELIRRGLLVVGTGCWAIGVAKAGLLDPQTLALASPGLQGFCRRHKLPPVMHMGSCVDCSRMLLLFAGLAQYLDRPMAELPLVAAAPEWATEKALTIGLYLAASGLPVQVWPPPPVGGGAGVQEWLSAGMRSRFGGYFMVEEQPQAAAAKLTAAADERRAALAWQGQKEGDLKA